MPLSDSIPSRVAAHRCDRSTRPANSKRLCDRSDRVSSSAYRPHRPRNAALHEERSGLAHWSFVQLAAQSFLHHFPQRLGSLEHDVPDEAIAYHHVAVAVEHIATFGVADEIETGLLEDAERLSRQLVAFAL